MGLFNKKKVVKEEQENATMIRATNRDYSSDTSELSNSALWMCVTSLCRQYATLPLHAYKRTSRGLEMLPDGSYLYQIMQHPNPFMTGYDFRFVMGFNFEMCGQAIALIERHPRTGYPVHLWPVAPSTLRQEIMTDGSLEYVHNPSGERFKQEEVLVINNTPRSWGSVLSPVEYAASDLELESMSKDMQKEFFKGSSVIGNVITVPEKTTEEAMDKIKARFDTNRGFKNFVLRESVKIEPIHVQNGDIGKITEAQKWSAREVAKRFGVPPFMAGDTDTTYGNAEQQGLQMVIYCLQPRIRAWETALNAALCAKGQCYEFSLQGLMRGDHAARSAFYQSAIMNGWMSINEVRGLENLAPIKDGDAHFFPMNYGTVGDIVAGKYAPNAGGLPWDTEEAPAPDKAPLSESELKEKKKLEEIRMHEAVAQPIKLSRAKLERKIRAFIKKEIAELKRLLDTGLPVDAALTAWNAWLNQKASEMAPEFSTLYLSALQRMLPLVKQWCQSDLDVQSDRIEAWSDKYVKELMLRHTGHVYTRLAPVVGTENEEAATTSLIDDYPIIESEEEVNRFTNAGSVFFFSALGVAYMHSVARPGACAFCRKIDGKICSVNGYILDKDTDEKDDDGNIRHIKKNYRHPPYHGHCSCFMAPGP